MRAMRNWISAVALCLSLGALTACPAPVVQTPDDLTTTPKPDMTKVHDMAFFSNCGQPGDPGNSIGVGKFCMAISDCNNNGKATLCARLGDPNNYFCTFMCDPAKPADCGDGATCSCQGGQCGCTPNHCFGGPPDGGH